MTDSQCHLEARVNCYGELEVIADGDIVAILTAVPGGVLHGVRYTDLNVRPVHRSETIKTGSRAVARTRTRLDFPDEIIRNLYNQYHERPAFTHTESSSP